VGARRAVRRRRLKETTMKKGKLWSGRSLGRVLGAAAALLAACVFLPANASAFDTGPHFDMTRDVLTAEGFGDAAVRAVQVNNWFVDLYENEGQNPYSGHAAWWKEALVFSYGSREHWPQSLLDASERSHFDSSEGGFENAAELQTEWNRLRRGTYEAVTRARRTNDPILALTALGISLHQVQDFYTHSNWVEARPTGPGWGARGHGQTPTWFDVPLNVRNAEVDRLYTAGSHPGGREHGTWKGGANAMAKDWPGSRYYDEAHMAAYYGSRQWVHAVRSWIADEAFWQRVRAFAVGGRLADDLAHDVRGAVELSFYAGHWQGQGEPFGATAPGPGGSVDDVAVSVRRYFTGRSKTVFRATWERTILSIAAKCLTNNGPNCNGRRNDYPLLRDASGRYVEVPLGAEPRHSGPLQAATQFVRLQITSLKGLGAGDIGPDEADFYTRATIAGQPFLSAFLHGYDSFSFNSPNYPFTFLKSVPRRTSFAEPLYDLRVEVKTSDRSWAGTDDNVYLRINDQVRYQLDKPVYNDFERGDRDMYSLPVDQGLSFFQNAPSGVRTVGDIRYLQIEKSPDGAAGGWSLGGFRVWANGRLIYQRDGIDRWLEDNTRTYRAPGFAASFPSTAQVPVWVALYDADSFLYGGDDHADINPFHDRYNLGLGYAAGTLLQGTAEGGDVYGGRFPSGDKDRARLTYRLTTLAPTPPPSPGVASVPVGPVAAK
jgi:hypothetical protein